MALHAVILAVLVVVFVVVVFKLLVEDDDIDMALHQEGDGSRNMR